jgi:multicomponent Na+:H+ antiporter subunit B
MSDRLRLCLFLPAIVVLGVLFLLGFRGLPSFGSYPGPYGFQIDSHAVRERHLTNMPSAVNFDYRGFDTLGEEYILFAAVAGLSLLLRQARGEIEADPKPNADDREVPPQGDAIRWFGLILTGVTIVFGGYVVVHAHLTPGGGFQGGTVLGTACLLVYLVVGYQEFRAVGPKGMVEAAEAIGAGGYAIIGLATMLASGAFLRNALPLGKTGDLFSAGTVPLINLAVGLEVAGGFVVLFAEFLKETRKPSEKPGP